MAYTVDDFPIETDQPQIEVTLPLGRHVLELVVEDSAGLRSEPATVVITVEREAVPEPVITGITPDSGRQGTTVSATISGENLLGATSVEFSGDGVTAEIRLGGTATTLPITITVAEDAAPTRRSFIVTTPSGTAESPPVFTVREVVAEPVITGITPDSGRQGTTVDATISGRNLLGATRVEFEGTGVTAEIRPRGTATRLPITITVAEDAAPTRRSFIVTTPSGTAESPPIFTVTEAVAEPVITGITPDSGRQGTTVDAIISGRNLLGATRVEFEGTGVTAEIRPRGTATRLPISITITPRAALGSRRFGVRTPQGDASSGRVTFTVALLITTRPPITPPPITTRPPIITTPPPITTRPPIITPPPIITTRPPVITPPPIITTRPPIITTRPPIRPVGHVEEVRGIGSVFAGRLEADGITTLDQLAEAEPQRIAELLGVSEVRAMGFVDEARRLWG